MSEAGKCVVVVGKLGGGCSPAEPGAHCPGKGRVRVRAKVLYGSGVAIANLRAEEKTANRPHS